MYTKLFSISLLLLFATACSPPLGQMARLKGYSTLCTGKVVFSAKEAEGLTTSLDLPSGERELFVEADSEPQGLDEWPTLAGEACFYRSTHSVALQLKPGKTYRLHLDQTGPKDFSISAHEGIDSSAVDTIPVPAQSHQLTLEERCSFAGGGWCPQWSSQ